MILKKWFTLLVVMMPFLSMYTAVAGIDLDTILFLITIPFLVSQMINSRDKIRTSTPLLILIFYVAIITTINLLVGTTHYSSQSSIILRTGRYCLLMFTVLVLGLNDVFDYGYAIKALRTVTLLAVAYIFIQLAVYFATGFILPNSIGGALSTNIYGTTFPRLESFANEPAEFVYYTAIYLTYCMFNTKQLSRKKTIEVLFISAGILISTSGQGLLVLVILWGIMFARKLVKKESRQSKAFFILTLPIIAIALFGLSNSELVNYTIDRVINPASSYTAVNARSTGYQALELLPTKKLIFGVGFGNYIDYGGYYYSSFAEIIFCTGIVGLILVLAVYFPIFFKGDLVKKVLVIISIALMLGGGIYTANYLCIYLSLMLYGIYTDQKLPIDTLACSEKKKDL
jgi:hypothetical protein